MDEVVFLPPISGQYFRPDGLMTSDVPVGTEPLIPTAAQLGDFFEGLTGDQIISGEANWGDLGLEAADLASIGPEVRTVVEMATEVATMASGYGAIVAVRLKLRSWMTKEGGSKGGGADQVADFILNPRTTLDLLQGRSRTAMLKGQDYMYRDRPQDAFSLDVMAVAECGRREGSPRPHRRAGSTTLAIPTDAASVGSA